MGVCGSGIYTLSCLRGTYRGSGIYVRRVVRNTRRVFHTPNILLMDVFWDLLVFMREVLGFIGGLCGSRTADGDVYERIK